MTNLETQYDKLQLKQQELFHKSASYFAMYHDYAKKAQEITQELSLLEESISEQKDFTPVQLELFGDAE